MKQIIYHIKTMGEFPPTRGDIEAPTGGDCTISRGRKLCTHNNFQSGRHLLEGGTVGADSAPAPKGRTINGAQPIWQRSASAPKGLR